MCRFALLLFFITLSTPARAADVEAMAEQLARLRAEVETLSADIEGKKEDLQTELRALNAQKTNLWAELQRERLRMKQLERSVAEHRERVKEADSRQGLLKPAVLEAVQAVRAAVKSGLPFRVAERLADLDRLYDETEKDVIAPSACAARLWARVEDELRLGRENGLYQQVIKVDAEEVLADVARIGMVMMYFMTPDGRVGRAVYDRGTWRYVRYEAPEDKSQIDALFESLKKRVRVGFFELPNALPQTKETER